MRKFLLTGIAALALAGAAANANAAEFGNYPCTGEAAKKQGCRVLAITGEIKEGDDEKFRAYVAPMLSQLNYVVVYLHSPGGIRTAALEIGRLVRGNGWSTYVPNNYVCASMCTAIWLAGEHRFYQEKASIGVHSVYFEQKKKPPVVSGGGNAVVGAYYRDLGLDDNAIYTLTAPIPTQMLWLTPELLAKLKIKAEFVPTKSAQNGR
jgi:hypothetical protein